MNSSSLKNAFAITLKRFKFSLPSCTQRRFINGPVKSDQAKSNGNEVTDIAVLGGGITGLASAFFLRKSFPKSKITLFESSGQLGNWLRSTKIDVDGREAIFEHGPRTLRPSGTAALATLNLIRQLRIQDDVLLTSKDSPAARNRYIYYPDHLVRLPSPHDRPWPALRSILNEPLYDGSRLCLFTEALRPRRKGVSDESIGSFFRRRFSAATADNIVSAGIHGIYAGDIDQLSLKAIMPTLFALEEHYDSVSEALLNFVLRRRRIINLQAEELEKKLSSSLKLWEYEREHPGNLHALRRIQEASVYTFKGGLGHLAAKLVESLKLDPNIKIRLSSPVTSLKSIDPGQTNTTPQQTSIIQLQYTSVEKGVRRAEVQKFSRVISTVSGKALNSMTQPGVDLGPLAHNPSVTVMVVNLFYTNPSLLPVRGFGYLIPRSVPSEQNPECGLGVVFDSESSVGQDAAPGTKVTVMLGGHWWSDWPACPSEAEGEDMARSLLRRHLGIADAPRAAVATLQRECIPQYLVGHDDRLRLAHETLAASFAGKVRVAGSSCYGVGVNDCVKGAYEVVRGLKSGKSLTGLEASVRGGTRWKVVDAV